MPTYEYRCLSCEHQFERFQRMTEDPVKECEACGAAVKRLLFPVAIHFKGSGFYSTDYARKNALGSAGTQAAGDSGSEKPSPAEGAKGEESKSASSEKSGSSESGSSSPVPATAKKD